MLSLIHEPLASSRAADRARSVRHAARPRPERPPSRQSAARAARAIARFAVRLDRDAARNAIA